MSEHHKPSIRDLEVWSNEKYLELFRGVEAEPCLWKRTDKNHSKRDKIEAALQKIASSLECTPVEVQTRWRSMRQTYFKYLIKEKKNKSGSAKKPWRFMNALNFLKCEATEPGGIGTRMGLRKDTRSDEVKGKVPPSHKKAERPAKRAKVDEVQPVYDKPLPEILSSQDDEYVEKGNEIGNALRRIARKNRHMADEVYISIRRLILDKEESFLRGK